MSPRPASRDSLRLVTFRRGEVTYALPIAQVRRVVRVPGIRPLATASEFVAGAARVNERLEVLVDPAKLFGSPAEGTASRAVLVTCAGREWGFLADSVGDLLDVSPAQMAALPPFLGGARAFGVRGVLLRGEEEEVLLLDPASLLSEAERSALPAAGSAAPAD